MKSERLELIREDKIQLPPLEDTLEFLKKRKKPCVATILKKASDKGTLLFQPRCGVGSHLEMIQLLRYLESSAKPDILSVTIDSYTRLRKFQSASGLLKRDPSQLNGYPLVSHGWKYGRELEDSVEAPLEIRHGSPDARALFETALASGITSFEGGGICYNLPYCKDVPLTQSLKAWQYVDRVTGSLANEGVIIDRELFGTLSAVLIPPAISLSMTLLEAILAAKSGVRCLSIAYPQSGNIVQDVAALRAMKDLTDRSLPPTVSVYPVFHEFMGVFPKDQVEANALILYGAMTAKLGRATKIITKTSQEALGIPTAAANAEGILTARMASNSVFDFIRVSEEDVEEEAYWIKKEVEEIISPVLEKEDLIEGIASAFKQGLLDVPFSTSRFAHSKVIPVRDFRGAIRYLDSGGLALSPRSKRRNIRLVSRKFQIMSIFDRVYRDIHYFSSGAYKANLESRV